MVCGVWCVVCGVRCVVCGVWCVACGVWRVACGVWRVACGVWRVACGVWCVRCEMQHASYAYVACHPSQFPFLRKCLNSGSGTPRLQTLTSCRSLSSLSIPYQVFDLYQASSSHTCSCSHPHPPASNSRLSRLHFTPRRRTPHRTRPDQPPFTSFFSTPVISVSSQFHTPHNLARHVLTHTFTSRDLHLPRFPRVSRLPRHCY